MPGSAEADLFGVVVIDLLQLVLRESVAFWQVVVQVGIGVARRREGCVRAPQRPVCAQDILGHAQHLMHLRIRVAVRLHDLGQGGNVVFPFSSRRRLSSSSR